MRAGGRLLACGLAACAFVTAALLTRGGGDGPAPAAQPQIAADQRPSHDAPIAFDAISTQGARDHAPRPTNARVSAPTSRADRLSMLQGRVVDAVTGDPVSGFRVSWSLGDAASERCVDRRSVDGRFRVPAPPGRALSITVDGAVTGYGRAVVRDVILPLARPLTVTLSPSSDDRSTESSGQRLVVCVRDAAGRALPGAEVLVWSAGHPPRRAHADDHGLATTARLGDGRATLRVTHTGFATQTRPLSDDERLRVDVTLQRTKPMP